MVRLEPGDTRSASRFPPFFARVERILGKAGRGKGGRGRIQGTGGKTLLTQGTLGTFFCPLWAPSFPCTSLSHPYILLTL